MTWHSAQKAFFNPSPIEIAGTFTAHAFEISLNHFRKNIERNVYIVYANST